MPTAARDTLQQALSHARSGNLAEAEELCEDLLAQPAVDPEARHLLGVIRNIQCRYAEAEPLLRQAVAEHPAIAKYHSNLGNALRGLERLAEAEACYRRALTLDPALDDARVNLAKLLHTTRQWDEAIVEYRQPDNAQSQGYWLASQPGLLASIHQSDRRGGGSRGGGPEA